MRSKVLALSLVVITLVVTSPAALARQETQTSDEWSAVKTVPIGEKLAVEMKNGKKLQGALSVVSDTRLTLSQGRKVTDIERDNIRRVYRVVSKSIAKSVGKSTLIGAAVGLSGGAGAGLALGAYEDISTAGVMGLLGLLGAGIGAGIGAMSGLLTGAKKEKVLIYGSR